MISGREVRNTIAILFLFYATTAHAGSDILISAKPTTGIYRTRRESPSIEFSRSDIETPLIFTGALRSPLFDLSTL